MKRAVRVGLYDSESKKLIYNTAQVHATWQQSAEDKWAFPTSSSDKLSALSPVLFRHYDYKTSDGGLSPLSKALDREKVFFIFELVLYVRAKVEHTNADGTKSVVDTTREYSCAHALTEVKNAHTPTPKKMVLTLNGGSPSFGTGALDPAEVNRVRTGLMNAVKRMGRAAATAPSTITVTFNPIKATDHRAYHLKLMPSTCVLNSCILPFVSGFRNHTGK